MYIVRGKVMFSVMFVCSQGVLLQWYTGAGRKEASKKDQAWKTGTEGPTLLPLPKVRLRTPLPVQEGIGYIFAS